MTNPPAELIVTSPDGHLARYKLGEKTVIGRYRDCEIILTDPMSSRRHCRIERDPEGRYFAQDNESANGTLLNDQPLKERLTLKDGDRLQIGSTLMVLRVEDLGLVAWALALGLYARHVDRQSGRRERR